MRRVTARGGMAVSARALAGQPRETGERPGTLGFTEPNPALDATGHLEYRSNGTTHATDIPAVSWVALTGGGSDRVTAYGEGHDGHVWQTILNNRYAVPPTSYDGNVAGDAAADTA